MEQSNNAIRQSLFVNLKTAAWNIDRILWESSFCGVPVCFSFRWIQRINDIYSRDKVSYLSTCRARFKNRPFRRSGNFISTNQISDFVSLFLSFPSPISRENDATSKLNKKNSVIVFLIGEWDFLPHKNIINFFLFRGFESEFGSNKES